jgi:glyoxylase-like metal-dependent hydrolase (beta-lactamase superfamily II)
VTQNANGDPNPAADWTTPGAYEVARGVHRIPLPLPTDGLRAVNVYAIESEAGLTLLDGGWAIDEARSVLEASLGDIGYKLRDITRFLVTHVHRDHYSNAVAVRREFGSHVTLGFGEKANLEVIHDDGLERESLSQRLRRAGAPDLARQWEERLGDQGEDVDNYAEPDTWLDGDHTLEVGNRAIEAVATPGHTRGHYVFADLQDGLLFAGDHVLPTITPSIGFEPAAAELPLRDFLGSLGKVRKLPDMRLLPAHGPVTESVHDRVDELLAHHDVRMELCLEALEPGPSSGYAIARELPWTRRHRSFTDLDPFNAGLATMETVAHLELLVAQGRATSTVQDGHVVYALRRLRGLQS